MYVKVNGVEFKSKDAMEKALSLYLLNLAEWMVGVQFLLTMNKSDHSAVYITIYISEDDADDALVGREKYIQPHLTLLLTSFTKKVIWALRN